MKAVWPDVIVEENNLNQSISAVRRILGDTRDQHRYVVTIPGVGYQFVADVKVIKNEDGQCRCGPCRSLGGEPRSGAGICRRGRGVAGADDGLPISTAPAAVPASPGSGQQPEHETGPACAAMGWHRCRARARRRLGVDVHSTCGTADRFSTRLTQPTTEPQAENTAPRLAIMPFTNLSPEPANAFFADGLHEEILSTLAERIPGIAVISRTTMMSYRQNPKPLGEVAQELGATHVMEGTVRREGDHVRLTLQLVDAGTDRYLWSQTYDRALASAMTLQSEVAADVAKQMSVRLARGGAADTRTDSRSRGLRSVPAGSARSSRTGRDHRSGDAEPSGRRPAQSRSGARPAVRACLRATCTPAHAVVLFPASIRAMPDTVPFSKILTLRAASHLVTPSWSLPALTSCLRTRRSRKAWKPSSPSKSQP